METISNLGKRNDTMNCTMFTTNISNDLTFQGLTKNSSMKRDHMAVFVGTIRRNMIDDGAQHCSESHSSNTVQRLGITSDGEDESLAALMPD